ncbi:hypothetical protein [Emticicia sp. C21]|uniref:Kelch repeat-containing protein n=1 Tax=Emticicia sp. C21 TaxID=2302915 RepID=UPI000E346070|nr:hypothetical protein [Emticicia sp. C21]RFS16920.1 hypothetical protein D0T08_09590 [Emticicia sp. C21]
MLRIILTALMLFPLFGIAQSGTVATDGVYVPRLSTVQRNAIATPVNGQMIYNTDDNCFNLFQKDTWQKLCGMNMEVTTNDDWVRKGDFGTTRVGAVGFSIGSKGYVGTGASTMSGTSLADFWEYNPVTDVWTQRANFGGGGRKDAVGFSMGNKGYVGTGGTSDFWEYNPVTNVWRSRAAVGGGARSGAVGFSIGNKGYIGTGSSKEDFWEYDTTANAWSQKANFGGGTRTNAVGFSIANRGYIGTGISGTTKKVDFWEYDPIANSWTQKANFGGTARTGASGFSINNKGYIGTGNVGLANDVVPENDVWEYSPSSNSWTVKSSFWRTGRIDGVGFSIGNKGYMGLGYDLDRSDDPYVTKDFYEYTPNITSLSIDGNLSIGGLLNSPDFIAPTLLNSWVNFGSGYSTVGYYKDKESVVHLKGFIKGGTTTQNTVLFTLPFGYHPSETRVFTVASGDGTFGRVNITSLGSVQFYSGVNTYLSLDGISFRAEE